MKTLRSIAVLVAAMWTFGGQASILGPKFSIDPASLAIDGVITPDDVLESGPDVFRQGAAVGLEEDFFSGIFDNLNALSFGTSSINRGFVFSVDRVAIGLPGTAVASEARPGSEEAAGDLFVNLPRSGGNSLFTEERQLGLTPGFFGDDIDALALHEAPTSFTYMSVDFLSVNGALSSSILVSDSSASFRVFADGVVDIGLDSMDDLDALVLLDKGNIGQLDPGLDLALFSISAFSPSAFTSGLGGLTSPADILITNFTGEFSIWAEATDLGLRRDDELDALETVPEPGSFKLLTIGLIIIWAIRRGWSRWSATIRAINSHTV